MKKIGKKFIIHLILFIQLLVLSSCAYTEEEKRMMEQYEKIGRKNAITYIEEKYGYTPSVEGLKCETVAIALALDPSPAPTGYVYVEMYDKKSDIHFWVYATGEEEGTQECWDNYQHGDIEKAVEYQLEALLGTDTEHIDLTYGKFGDEERTVKDISDVDREFGLLHDYFDGTNLAEILSSEEYNNISVCMVENNHIPDLLGYPLGEINEEGIYEGTISNNNEVRNIFGENVKCLFVNYNDAQAYTTAHEDGCVASVTSYDFNIDMDNMCFYIKDQYYVAATRDSEIFTRYAKYDVQKYNEFYYIPMGGTYCNFTEADDELCDESQWNGRGFLNAKKVYGAYRVDSDAARIYIFIPISSIEAEKVTEYMVDRSNIRIVDQHYYNDDEKGWTLSLGTCVTDIVGNSDTEEYLTATIYLHDFYKDKIFSVFVEEEESDNHVKK